MTMGEKMQKLRKQKNWSQETLAEKLGVSRQAVSLWERGESMPEIDKLIPLANYLGVTVDFLLTDYIVTDEDNSLNILTQLFRGKTVEEKELAVNMLKLLFSYTDGKI